MRKSKLWTVIGGAVIVASAAQADEITIAGYEYKNVLITKTSSFYYVQLPEEGRTLSIPVGEVPQGSVKINSDPFYRTPLKATYDENRQRRAEGEIKDIDPAFRGAATTTAGGDASAGAPIDGDGGGGGGAGMGVPRTMLEQGLSSFGFQFTPGPTSAVGKRADGTSIELLGPPDSLQGIVAKLTGAVAAVDAGAQQFSLLLMQMSPEAGTAYTQAYNEAKQNGSASKSAGGVSMSISRKVNGDNADVEVRLTPG